ncbi:MAG: hypothetical protein ACD_4C00306G0006, partial [uncultured bacterium (gcode 4)]
MQKPNEKSDKVELSEFDKELIRAYVQEVDNKEEKQKRRKECSEKFWVSIGTIAAITAWTVIKEKKSNSSKIKTVTNETPPKVINIILSQNKQKLSSTPIQFEKIKDSVAEIQKIKILEEMKDIIFDSEEILEINNHIACIAEHYWISPWTVELLARQNIVWAISLIDKARKESSKNIILDDIQKDAIRLYVSQWNTVFEKQKRRDDMSKEYNVWIRVISAITAWDTIRKNRSEKSEKEYIENDLETKKILIWNLDQDNVDLDDLVITKDWRKNFIIELAGDFKLQDSYNLEIFYKDIKDLLPEYSKEDIDLILKEYNLFQGNEMVPELCSANNKAENESIISWEWMWTLINYDNEIKNAWRQKLKEFIDKNTDKEKRKQMKILCLPWIECLEIPIYLELWFLPENIVWVEAGIVKWKVDIDVLKRFEENTKKYWIQHRLWKLEKVLETEEEVFDIVSLDFLGFLTNKYLDILCKIKTKNNFLLLTNFMWKRENSSSQKILNHISWIKTKGNIVLENNFNAREEYEEKYKNTKEWNIDINSDRSNWIFRAIEGSIWREITEEFMYPEIINELKQIIWINENTELWRYIEVISLSIFQNLYDFLLNYIFDKSSIVDSSLKRKELNIIFPALTAMFFKWICWMRQLECYKSYKYTSSSKRWSTTMFSDFIKMDRSASVCNEIRHSIKFFLLILKEVFLATDLSNIQRIYINNPWIFQIKDSDWRLKKQWDKITKKDYIIFVINNKEICRIQYGKIFRDPIFFAKHENKFLKLDDWFTHDRKEIFLK